MRKAFAYYLAKIKPF